MKNADPLATLTASRRRMGALVMLLNSGLLCLTCWGSTAEQLPKASDVTRRMIERSQALASDMQGPQYIYEKRSLLERLDAAGRPMNSEEKVYQVTLVAGLPSSRLVKIQGRELSGEELRREDARQESFRRRFVSADAKKLAAQNEGVLTPELLDRYQFAVEQRMVLSNRATLVLTFKPKEGDLPSSSIQDKLLNLMAGKVWVDEADADTARLEVSLVAPLSLGWFGFLGSLSRCEMSLERQRMPDGVWVNTKQVLFIQFRRLTATLRFRTKEACSGFQKVEVKR